MSRRRRAAPALETAPVIGSVTGFWGSFAPGRSAAPGSSPARLLDNSGARLHSLDSGRSGVERIKAALTELRGALQAARDGADPVPGRTALKPVIAEIERTADKPTYVTIDGEVEQNGTITTSLGKRPLVVGFDRLPRAPLDARDALNALATTVGMLVSTVGPDGTGGFVDAVTGLLRSGDLVTAVQRPDKATIDTALGRIDAVLAGAEGLQSSLAVRESAAAQIDLGGLLLGAAPDAVVGEAGVPTGGNIYASATGGQAPGNQFSFLA